MNFGQQFPIVFASLNTGFLQTLRLFVVTLAGALPLGMLLAVAEMSRFKPLRAVIKTLVWIIRGSPLMIQLLIIFYLPGLVFKTPLWPSGENGRFAAASVAFIINYACYFSEIFRGGIQSIPVGQYEAGAVLGMTRRQIFNKIILLQVIKRIVPPISNEVITLVKDTSLARVIAVYEIIWNGQAFIKSSGIIWPLFYTGAFYLIFSGLLTFVFGYIEKKLSYFR